MNTLIHHYDVSYITRYDAPDDKLPFSTKTENNHGIMEYHERHASV